MDPQYLRKRKSRLNEIARFPKKKKKDFKMDEIFLPDV